MAQYQTFTGNAPDVYGSRINFSARSKAVYIAAYDNNLDISAAYEQDESMFEGDIEVPAGTILQTPLACKAIKVRNHTPGSVARYEITAWYIPTPYQ